MSALTDWLLGLIPKAVDAVLGKPGEKLEEPLGQSEADKAKGRVDDARRAKREGRH